MPGERGTPIRLRPHLAFRLPLQLFTHFMPTPPPAALRTDIQALRGFAVLVVLLYHAKIGFFSAGYLGVDVFFVISGFLITRLIKKGIEGGNFHFSTFYFRRAKRLLPAAYVTFLVTALLAPFFLTSSEMLDLRTQMLGAVTFTANIVLWRQSGYFGGTAELKPLLHVWSLAIEEQYYFLLPAVLVFVPRRLWLKTALLTLVTSLVLCFFMMQAKPNAAFYWLPTRGWELMFGSVGALVVVGEGFQRYLKAIFWPALAVLLALPVMHLGADHPGPGALLICLATLVVILRQHPLLSQWVGMQGLSKVGDMSYSLYLVHWPVFAFLNNVWITESGGEHPLGIRASLIALSLCLAYVLHRYVEVRFRHADIQPNWRAIGRVVAASTGLVLVTVGLAHGVASDKDYSHIRRANQGFGEACEFTENFAPIAACRNSDNPEFVVWGDSFAMHLVPGLLGVAGGAPGIVQATRSECGPLMGLAPQSGQSYNNAWGQSCIRFNDSVVEYLKTAQSVKTVVLSSPFDQYLDNDRPLLVRNEGQNTYRVVQTDAAQAVEGLKRTAAAVRALGKKVVVVAPPPMGGFDVARCTERAQSGLPTIGIENDCAISMVAYRTFRAKVLALMEALPQQAGIEVISFDPYLCGEGVCQTSANGTFVYRDGGHLSYEGSVYLANKMSLVDKIRLLAN